MHREVYFKMVVHKECMYHFAAILVKCMYIVHMLNIRILHEKKISELPTCCYLGKKNLPKWNVGIYTTIQALLSLLGNTYLISLVSESCKYLTRLSPRVSFSVGNRRRVRFERVWVPASFTVNYPFHLSTVNS